VEDARRVAAAKIEELEEQLRSCLQALDRIKTANRPTTKPGTAVPYDFDSEADPVNAVDPADAVADEIASSLEALVGTTEDAAPKADPKHPVSDTTTKFANLKFGPNYDPTAR
jgi:hypothetical protein